MCMYVNRIMCWRKVCLFSMMTKNVKNSPRSKLAFFSPKWVPFWIWFKKKTKQTNIFQKKKTKTKKKQKQKQKQKNKKQKQFCTWYLHFFLKTRGNKNKQWTRLGVLNRITVCSCYHAHRKWWLIHSFTYKYA